MWYIVYRPRLLISECAADMFGLNCSLPCLCNTQHTYRAYRDCDIVTGSCTCFSNWTGVTCDEDVNECEFVYCSGTDAVCRNTPGDYICECPDNFARDNDGDCFKGKTFDYRSMLNNIVTCFN